MEMELWAYSCPFLLPLPTLSGVVPILILPGWQDSGPEHWQSHWLKKYPNAVKVEQEDWMNARKDEWVSSLNRYIERVQDRELVLVGHSLACPTIVHWTRVHRNNTSKIKGALLVAPGDVEQVGFPKEIQNFSPLPLEPLPFKTILVTSDNDVWISLNRAQFLAKSWGSKFVLIPGGGHINPASGFGEWPEGEVLLKKLMFSDGKPMAKPDPLFGSMKGRGKIVGDIISPIDVEWNAEKGLF